MSTIDLFGFTQSTYIGNREWISNVAHFGDWLDRMETKPGVARAAS